MLSASWISRRFAGSPQESGSTSSGFSQSVSAAGGRPAAMVKPNETGSPAAPANQDPTPGGNPLPPARPPPPPSVSGDRVSAWPHTTLATALRQAGAPARRPPGLVTP